MTPGERLLNVAFIRPTASLSFMRVQRKRLVSSEEREYASLCAITCKLEAMPCELLAAGFCRKDSLIK